VRFLQQLSAEARKASRDGRGVCRETVDNERWVVQIVNNDAANEPSTAIWRLCHHQRPSKIDQRSSTVCIADQRPSIFSYFNCRLLIIINDYATERHLPDGITHLPPDTGERTPP